MMLQTPFALMMLANRLHAFAFFSFEQNFGTSQQKYKDAETFAQILSFCLKPKVDLI